MKISPAGDEKSLLSQNNKTLVSGLRGRNNKRGESYKCQNVLKQVVEGKIAIIVMSIVTVFALIGDDIRLWATTKEADPFFYAGLVVSFALFTTEILINSIVIEDFKYSFFFWLDIIATLSLIPDIKWILDLFALLIGGTPSYESVNAVPGELSIESLSQSKIQKVIKSLRLIRLIRIIKLYKYIVQSKKDDDGSGSKKKKKEIFETTTEEENEQSLFKKETDPSKLGKALSDTTTRRVIIGVLLMLMILPLLSYSEIDFSSEYGLREIFWFGRSSCNKAQGDFFCEQNNWLSHEGWEELLRRYASASFGEEGDDLTKELVWLYVPDYTLNGRMNTIRRINKQDQSSEDDPFWQQIDSCAGFEVHAECPFRFEEMDLATYSPIECQEKSVPGCDQLIAYARFNKRYEKVQEAILQFSTTIFTCFVLTIASLTFNNDTQQIVIKPIQKIVEIIQRLADNPLKKPEHPKKDDDGEKNSQMKTQMLELTIFKISTLLQRGFGELGAKIVSRTFTNTEEYMDLMIPGKKMNLVFSVCRIRQFTETTESLQDEIIVFVNKIVKIVHEVAKKWDGLPTKNYGDKYLLTWRLPNFKEKHNDKNPDLLQIEDAAKHLDNSALDHSALNQTLKQAGVQDALIKNNIEVEDLDNPSPKDSEGKDEDITEKRKEIADKALISAVKIVVELRRAQDLQAYSRHPKIAPKFGQNYRTKVSFGLHVGWAIEGAVGTEQKIDALFLSPDAQIANRIEEFSAQYDTSILLSGNLYQLLSEKGKNTLRLIDNIVMNESKETPREIYTFDMNFSDGIDNPPHQQEGYELGALFKHSEFENNSIDQFKTDGVDYMFQIDHDFHTFKQNRKEIFETYFKQVYYSYKEGDWINAQNNITSCLEVFQEDGPCLALSEYMEKYKNIPPDTWTGYRDIDEKDAAPSMSFIKPAFDDELLDEDNEELDDDESLS